MGEPLLTKTRWKLAVRDASGSFICAANVKTWDSDPTNFTTAANVARCAAICSRRSLQNSPALENATCIFQRWTSTDYPSASGSMGILPCTGKTGFGYGDSKLEGGTADVRRHGPAITTCLSRSSPRAHLSARGSQFISGNRYSLKSGQHAELSEVAFAPRRCCRRRTI